jgi:excisionase family DNA binding protein
MENRNNLEGNQKKKIKTWAVGGEDFGTEVGSKNSTFFENRIVCEWLSTKEAAHYLRVSQNALRIMFHREQVQALKLGSRLRFRLNDLEALFK